MTNSDNVNDTLSHRRVFASAQIEAALRRAAIQARRRALGFSGYIVVMEDGKLIEIPINSLADIDPDLALESREDQNPQDR